MWLASADPGPMLDYLGERISERKLRLFAVACCRRHWALLGGEYARSAVEAAEGFAEGVAAADTLAAAANNANVTAYNAPFFEMPAHMATAETAAESIRETVRAATQQLQQVAYRAAAYGGLPGPDEVEEGRRAAAEERRAQAVLLREVAGNPFRPAAAEPLWLGWNDACVVRLARTIHADRRFEGMTILGDALEDAGCRDESIIDHCRAVEGHCLGCWVLDLLLARG